MKRFFTIFLAFLLASVSLQAQQVTTGVVTDKAGNPISGARVEAKGTTYFTTTGIDGRFSLESPVPFQKVKVSSPGKNPKTQYVSANTVVQLSDPTWLNSQATSYRWFVSPQVTFLGPDAKDVPFGLMAGVVKHFGAYGKFMYSGMPSTIESADRHDLVWNRYNFIDDYKTGFMSVTGGPVVRLAAPAYLMLGAGYARRKVALALSNGSYLEATSVNNSKDEEIKTSFSGFAAEAMLMVEYKHFTINVGSTMWSTDNSYFSFNLGVGYMF
ncbi:MAG: carboxypeptidase regulatory-like domain-containing protein [Bacteroidaceae bacterium]|nr:carboxypeptidase regulatory-like domain-containing protein [Bacteroidaceae bacterium]